MDWFICASDVVVKSGSILSLSLPLSAGVVFLHLLLQGQLAVLSAALSE